MKNNYKKYLKITLVIIGIIVSLILLDTFQAIILKHSPILSLKQPLEDDDSWVNKGILINTYYCTQEQDIVTINWKFKGSKFTCPIDNIENNQTNYIEVYDCLENELGAYILSEQTLYPTEIPLSDITDKKDQIEYYKSLKTNDNNMYIIFKENITSKKETIKDFELYFSSKFSTYQKYFIKDKNTYIFIHNNFNNINLEAISNKCNNPQN